MGKYGQLKKFMQDHPPGLKPITKEDFDRFVQRDVNDEEEDGDELDEEETEEEDDEDDEDDYTDELEDARAQAERAEAHALLAEQDALASEARIDKLEKKIAETDGFKTEPSSVLAPVGLGLLSASEVPESVYKWTEKKASGFFAAIEKWGADGVKKHLGFLSYVPFVGSWLMSAEKSLAETEKDRAAEAKKVAEAQKAAAEKTKKSEDTQAEKTKKALATKISSENKKIIAEQKRIKAEGLKREKELSSFMTDLEKYQLKHGDEKTKKELLKMIEDDLPNRTETRKKNEYEKLLVQHMTPDEKAEFSLEEVEGDSVLSLARIKRKEEIKAQVIAELNTPSRARIAEANKTKGKKGGGGGNRGNGGRGRP